MLAFEIITDIVQSAYKKCSELHGFVPIFLKKFLGEEPPPPFTCSLVLPMGEFNKLLLC